jgi:hypothetical protein
MTVKYDTAYKRRFKRRIKLGLGYEILLMGSGNPLVEEMMQCVHDHELNGQYYDFAENVTDLLIRAGSRILELEKRGAWQEKDDD